MRILLLTSFDLFPPVHGGSSVAYNFIKHAATRHDVSALISHLYSLGGDVDLTSDNVHISYYRPSLFDHLRVLSFLVNPHYYRAAERLCRESQPDVIQCETLWPVMAGWYLRRRYDVPLVCDCSSDFLCRPVPIQRYGILYACAQKNAGPAGVTIVIIRDDLVQNSPGDLPSMLNYRVMVEGKSLFNTPPAFSVYMVKLVTNWLLSEVGGLEKMHQLNQRKAKLLYDVIDQSDGFYQKHAQPASRSIMNVTFRLPDSTLEAQFLKETESRDLCTLKGHRSVGGCRASIYNAMPLEGVQALRDFMLEFHQKNGGGN